MPRVKGARPPRPRAPKRQNDGTRRPNRPSGSSIARLPYEQEWYLGEWAMDQVWPQATENVPNALAITNGDDEFERARKRQRKPSEKSKLFSADANGTNSSFENVQLKCDETRRDVSALKEKLEEARRNAERVCVGLWESNDNSRYRDPLEEDDVFADCILECPGWEDTTKTGLDAASFWLTQVLDDATISNTAVDAESQVLAHVMDEPLSVLPVHDEPLSAILPAPSPRLSTTKSLVFHDSRDQENYQHDEKPKPPRSPLELVKSPFGVNLTIDTANMGKTGLRDITSIQEAASSIDALEATSVGSTSTVSGSGDFEWEGVEFAFSPPTIPPAISVW